MNLITARNLIIIVIISLSAWWSAWTLLDYNTYGAKATVALIPDNVDLTLKNIKQTKIRAGESLWTLVAESATQSPRDNKILLNNVQLLFFDKKAGNIEITANHGSVMSEYQKVTFSSNVLVADSSGKTLRTEYLEYDEISNIFQTDRMVEIIANGFVARGIGMQINVKDRTLILLSDVNASDTIDSR
jgi:LPS export ABC transporter protein LptC